MSYQDYKQKVMGRKIGDGECVSLVVNNSDAYVEYIWPGQTWTNIISPVVGAKDLLNAANQTYLQKIPNNHNDPNQLPQQGDILVFDATPQSGYTNTFNNPFGHTGICESANSSGYTMIHQNSPSSGSPVNLATYSWKYRPCIGWLRPKIVATPAPVTPVQPAQGPHTIFLPASTGPWHLYKVGGPYVPQNAKGLLWPSKFGGLTYNIDQYLGNGIYVITTHDYGQGAIWTQGSTVVVH